MDLIKEKKKSRKSSFTRDTNILFQKILIIIESNAGKKESYHFHDNKRFSKCRLLYFVTYNNKNKKKKAVNTVKTGRFLVQFCLNFLSKSLHKCHGVLVVLRL